MPKDAKYEEGVVLIRVDPTADPAEVERLLTNIAGVATQTVSASDVESGVVVAKLEPNVPVESAVNAVLGAYSPLVVDCQPNYIYHLTPETVSEVLEEEPAS